MFVICAHDPALQSKRSFMADDGTKFAWDEEKGDWKQVEGDEEEELEDGEEEVRVQRSVKKLGVL